MFIINTKLLLHPLSILLLCLLAILVCAQPSFAGAVFDENFENATVNKPLDSKEWGKCSGNCSIVTTEQTRSGKKALKSYLNRKKSNVSYRTEAVPRGEIRAKTQQFQHYWYGFSVYIPDSHKADSLSGDTIFQWHAVLDKDLGEKKGKVGGPPLSLQIQDNSLKVVSRWNSKAIGSKYDKTFGSRHYNVGSYKRGKWIDWVVHVKWSYKSDGILEVWKDGTKVVNNRGPNTYNDKIGPYPKLGLYKPPWRNSRDAGVRFDADITSRTIYHDEIHIAKGADATYKDVAPGGSPSASKESSDDILQPPTSISIIK